MRLVKRLLCIIFCLLFLMLLPACGAREGNQEDTPNTVEVVQPQALGDVFLNSTLKLKSTIVDSSISPAREITVELYVDSTGSGEGMLGFGDTVCEVRVVRDVLYILVDSGVVVTISDVTGRMVSSQTSLEGISDLTTAGFKVVGGTPVEYNAKLGDLTISTVFAQSANTFEPATLSTDNVMTFKDAINYIIDYNSQAGSAVTTEEENEVISFYLNSPYAIEIDDGVYSIGDTCNVSTYFGERTPEGILTSNRYKEDQRVDFTHVSYISETGRSSFTLITNYVQAIETSAQFTWLGLSKGMDTKYLGNLLGYRLSKKDTEGWTPIDEKLVLKDFRSNTYYCSVDSLNVELRCNSYGLDSIYIERPLDYVS